MKWTEPAPPTANVSWYDHILCDTPLGQAKIEWKSHKDYPSYSISVGDEYLTELYDDLETCKLWVTSYFIEKVEQINTFLYDKDN